jgi:NAD(P)-dependent dehydrogenase (short-subunit alcohol dehydrogenase family)
VAIVTGSSRGIGRAIAERLAEHGAQVVISSRKQDACEQVVQAINARHGAGRAIAVAASISSKEALQQLVDRTMAHFGRIDVLVCNAASNPYYGPMGGITDEQFRKILDNNVISNHWLIQMCLPQMIERKAGSIIIVSSIGGLRGSTTIGAYNISKAADFQLARNLAHEIGPHGVRVNCIAPGLDPHGLRHARSGRTPTPWSARRGSCPCAASASPTRSPAPPCSWRPGPAAS